MKSCDSAIVILCMQNLFSSLLEARAVCGDGLVNTRYLI